MRLLSRRIAALAVPLALAATALTALPAQSAVVGLWKVDCKYVGSSMDDPIVYPGQPGVSHMHDFFGNVGTNANSTLASMQGVASTCAKNDRSAYWYPALYKDGVKIKPSSFIAYYENRAPAGTTIKAYPPGFKMVFGNGKATAASQMDAHIAWGCSDNTQIAARSAPPASCSSGVIQLRLMWPYCWNGKEASGAGTSHVSFAPGGSCPASHPITLPTLRTNIYYPVGTTTGTISLASGLSHSAHGDFFNAWDQATLEDLVQTCLNGLKDCGHFKGTTAGTTPAATTSATAAPVTTPVAATSSAATTTSAAPKVTTSAPTSATTTTASRTWRPWWRFIRYTPSL